MNGVIIELIHALAIRPELLAMIALAVVIALMMRRRTKLTAEQKKNGTPMFKMIIDRFTHLMYGLAAVTAIREVANLFIAYNQSGGAK